MKRPTMRWRWRDLFFVLWLVATALLLGQGWRPTPTAAVQEEQAHGKSQAADMTAVRRRISEGRLAMQPARWTKRVNPPATHRPRAPAALRGVLAADEVTASSR